MREKKNMGFSKMIELLQQKNKGKIVFCNTGNFYIAIGKDAVLLNNLIDLKLSCLKQEICKVGFPINALEKYTELIAEKEYSYIVYFFNQEKEELEIIMQYEGKNNNEIKEKVNWKSKFYLEKVNSSYRVNAIYKQRFNAKTLIFAYF